MHRDALDIAAGGSKVGQLYGSCCVCLFCHRKRSQTWEDSGRWTGQSKLFGSLGLVEREGGECPCHSPRAPEKEACRLDSPADADKSAPNQRPRKRNLREQRQLFHASRTPSYNTHWGVRQASFGARKSETLLVSPLLLEASSHPMHPSATLACLGLCCIMKSLPLSWLDVLPVCLCVPMAISLGGQSSCWIRVSP